MSKVIVNVSEFKQWKGSNHKQSARWQHVSRLKASALLFGKINYGGFKNTAAYTWDWYYNLVGGRASLFTFIKACYSFEHRFFIQYL